MTFDALEREMYLSWRDGDFAGKYAKLKAFLMTATGVERGRALAFWANLAYDEDVRQLHQCLAMTDEALILLRGHHRASSLCLLSGLSMARVSCDIQRAENYAKRIRSIIATSDKNPDVVPWVGRLLLALCRYEEDFGDLMQALHYGQNAVAWHNVNIGPYNEDDRACYLVMSYTICAEILIKQYDFAQARQYVAAADALPVNESLHPFLDYIYVYQALAEGNATNCDVFLRRLEYDSPFWQEQDKRLRVAELKARYYVLVGDVDSAYECLHPYISQAADMGNARLALRLQRLFIRARRNSA